MFVLTSFFEDEPVYGDEDFDNSDESPIVGEIEAGPVESEIERMMADAAARAEAREFIND